MMFTGRKKGALLLLWYAVNNAKCTLIPVLLEIYNEYNLYSELKSSYLTAFQKELRGSLSDSFKYILYIKDKKYSCFKAL